MGFPSQARTALLDAAPASPVPSIPPARRAWPDAATALVVALIVSIPLAMAEAVWAAPGGTGDWQRSVTFAPVDVMLLVIGVWAVRQGVQVRRPRGVLPVTATVFAALFLVALVAHPSPLGVALGLRLAAGLAVARAVVRSTAVTGRRSIVLAAVAAVGVVQAVLAMVQAHLGHALGVAPLDFGGPLYPFGSSFAGRGGLPHPYHLAVLLCVTQGATLLGLRAGRRRWPWCLAIAIQAMGLAVTYSRSALLGEVAVLAVALVGSARPRDRRLLLPAALALVVGLGIGAAAFGNGWVSRSTQSTTKQVDTGRRDRLKEAGRLIAREPLVGVGPGRYVVALVKVQHTDLLPAHDLIAQEAAEAGVAAGVAAAVLLGAFVVRVARRGTWPLLVAAPVLPYLVLDAYPYVFTTGIALSGIWLGLIRRAAHPEPVAAAA